MKTHALRIATYAALALAACSPAGRDEAPAITVLAAASLEEALAPLAAEFGGRSRVRIDFASSGVLAKKVEAGAYADVFLSASPEYMESLGAGGLLLPGSRRAILTNRLVCVVPRASSREFASPSDLRAAGVKRLALGDPGHVPAGRYAKEALAYYGLWEELQPKTLPCADVRGALAHAEAGTVDAAIVYRSDAATSDLVRVAFTFADGSHAPIVYEGSVLKRTRHREAAEAFLAFVASSAGAFADHGFEPPPREAN